MKTVLSLLLTVILASALTSGDKPDTSAATPQFEKLKTLVGTWKAKDGEGRPVNATYRIVSNGNTLMESLDISNHADAMITMYHMDGSRLMMTHYCSMGNQPRMCVQHASDDGNSLTFSLVDVTNLSKPDDPHMSGLDIVFKDNDHFSQDWTMSMEDKEAHRGHFDFERVK